MSMAAAKIERARLADMPKCDICGEPHGNMRVITFLRVTIQHAIIDVDAVAQTVGLATMFKGNLMIADAFSPHHGEVMLPEELRETWTVCHMCAAETSVAELFEREKPSDGD